jgi:hypothetical protein
MPGDFWLALPQDFNQITDANLSPRNQVEQAQSRAIGQSGKQRDQGGGFGTQTHT